MKLIEVVVLLGAQCISPVQHTGTATEAAKVQCAVVIEKDTEAGTLRIMPAGASRQPEVVAVLERLEDDARTIEPAAAPPSPPVAAPVIAPPAPLAATAPEPPPAAEARPVAQEPQPEAVRAAKPKETPKAAAKVKARTKIAPSQEEKRAEKASAKSKCIGEAKPKWYTNAEGRRKYRCVLPG